MKSLLEAVLFFLLVGVLVFGVSYHGKRYQITCNERDGVGLEVTK